MYECFDIESGGCTMGIHKYKIAIIILLSFVIASVGIISFNFYQEAKIEKPTTNQQKSVKDEEFQEEIGIAETKVISAEMNPTEENIAEAEESVQVLSDGGEKQKLLDRIALVKEKLNRDLKAKEEARLAELREDINQAKIDLGIDQSPTEGDLLEILHNMTHQKVRSEEKWGFVQITEVNLFAVKEVLQENPAFNQNIDMLAIVNDWLNNDFNNIVAEHNLIWGMKDGSVGKAYGILSPKEEADLIKKQFGS